ncbi:MAG: hypothetical protein QNJ65_23765 [Xenococcaceae cyanobacterium MO_234.B1]|nr:hypothetical protein [Xenococcaceae cyanobacterium MO_234.B1]
MQPGTKLSQELQQQRITEELENAVDHIGLKAVVHKLRDICKVKHEQQPYCNWDKDAKLLDFLSSYIDNKGGQL